MEERSNKKVVSFFYFIHAISYNQRSYQRWLDKRIYITDVKFWAVLGSQGCRVKKNPNCHKYAIVLGGVFNFLWEKEYLKFS